MANTPANGGLAGTALANELSTVDDRVRPVANTLANGSGQREVDGRRRGLASGERPGQRPWPTSRRQGSAVANTPANEAWPSRPTALLWTAGSGRRTDALAKGPGKWANGLANELSEHPFHGVKHSGNRG